MSLLYHYVRDHCSKCCRNHILDIKKEKILKRELSVHNFSDDIDSSFIWFTDIKTVPGSASNYFLNLVHLFSNYYKKDLSKKEIDNIIEKDIANINYSFCCYVFDSVLINANKWNLIKVKWGRFSPKRNKYIFKIDNNSTINGDNIENFWVTEHEVDLSKKINEFKVTETRGDRLKRFGFENYYDFYIWQKKTVLSLYDKGKNNDEINTELGKMILQRI